MKAASSSLHVKVAGKEKADDGEDAVSCEEGIKVHRPQHCRSLRMQVIDEDNDADGNLLLKRSGFQKMLLVIGEDYDLNQTLKKIMTWL